jgi:hypothetical protein
MTYQRGWEGRLVRRVGSGRHRRLLHITQGSEKAAQPTVSTSRSSTAALKRLLEGIIRSQPPFITWRGVAFARTSVGDDVGAAVGLSVGENVGAWGGQGQRMIKSAHSAWVLLYRSVMRIRRLMPVFVRFTQREQGKFVSTTA